MSALQYDSIPVALGPSPEFNGYPALRLVDSSGFQRRAMFRRRRIMATALLIASLLGLRTLSSVVIDAFGATQLEQGAEVATLPTGSVLIVEAGQTYWSIAESMRPSGDIRETVDALIEANGGRPLRVGDRIFIPMGNKRD